MEELRGNLCSPSRVDNRSSSVAPDEGGESTDLLVTGSKLMKLDHFIPAKQAYCNETICNFVNSHI